MITILLLGGILTLLLPIAIAAGVALIGVCASAVGAVIGTIYYVGKEIVIKLREGLNK